MSRDFCRKVGQTDVCESRKVGNASYTYVLGGSSEEREVSKAPRFSVEARKSKAGARLALIRRLTEHQTKGVPYSAINAYFKKEFDDLGATDSMTGGFIVDMLVYDPRNDAPKDYPEVLAALNASSANLDWLQFWDIIDGLTWD